VLPDAAIARHPPADRDGARLYVLEAGRPRHLRITDLVELVPADSVVVLNDTRVRHARVLGKREGTGGAVELLLLRRMEQGGAGELWQALGRANRSLAAGAVVVAAGFSATVREVGAGGLLSVVVEAESGVEEWLARHGHVPIPPYLGRADEPADHERYQTVFARRLGSVAAPTAGLHFTEAALGRLRARGVEIATLTLSVGLGTFRPVEADDLDQHPMHAEQFEIGPELAASISRARARGAAVVAIGTTAVRALESAADPVRPGEVRPVSGMTELLIQPGFRFRVVDALLTNFHQPRSTLLALVSAFAGRDTVLSAYADALAAGFRFLSYGDAMWIPRRSC